MKCEKCGKPVKDGCYNTPYGVFCVDCWENKTDEKVKKDCKKQALKELKKRGIVLNYQKIKL